MTYPKTIPAVKDAILAFWPEDETVQAAYEAAMSMVSPVAMIVNVFDLLRPLSLSSDGSAVLKGCAHVIAQNAWFGRGEEALGVLMGGGTNAEEPDSASKA